MRRGGARHPGAHPVAAASRAGATRRHPGYDLWRAREPLVGGGSRGLGRAGSRRSERSRRRRRGEPQQPRRTARRCGRPRGPRRSRRPSGGRRSLRGRDALRLQPRAQPAGADDRAALLRQDLWPGRVEARLRDRVRSTRRHAAACRRTLGRERTRHRDRMRGLGRRAVARQNAPPSRGGGRSARPPPHGARRDHRRRDPIVSPGRGRRCPALVRRSRPCRDSWCGPSSSVHAPCASDCHTQRLSGSGWRPRSEGSRPDPEAATARWLPAGAVPMLGRTPPRG